MKVNKFLSYQVAILGKYSLLKQKQKTLQVSRFVIATSKEALTLCFSFFKERRSWIKLETANNKNNSSFQKYFSMRPSYDNERLIK